MIDFIKSILFIELKIFDEMIEQDYLNAKLI